MPDPLPRLSLLAAAFDAAYQTCARDTARPTPRQQSDEIIRHVARFCLAQDGRPCDQSAERKIIEALGSAAVDPLTLTALIAAMTAQSEDADFPAAALDPRGRQGWGRNGRIIAKPPWDSTDELLARLLFATDGLHGEKLHFQLMVNIEDSLEPIYQATDPSGRALVPLTLVGCHLLACVQRIRDLEATVANLETELQRSPCDAER